MKPTELSFGAVLKRYLNDAPHLWSWWEVSLAFLIAIAATAIVGFDKQAVEISNSIAGTIFAASTQFLGIVIAGFAISTAVLDPKFSRFALKVRALEGLLFPFWLNAVQWSVGMALSGILYLITSLAEMVVDAWLIRSGLFIVVLWFSLTVFVLISLVGVLFKLAVYRSIFEDVAAGRVGGKGNVPKDDTRAK